MSKKIMCKTCQGFGYYWYWGQTGNENETATKYECKICLGTGLGIEEKLIDNQPAYDQEALAYGYEL